MRKTVQKKIYIYSDLEEGALMAKPAFRIDGKFYTDNDWDRAIREGKESSSLTKEEKKGHKFDDSLLFLCRP